MRETGPSSSAGLAVRGVPRRLANVEQDFERARSRLNYGKEEGHPSVTGGGVWTWPGSSCRSTGRAVAATRSSRRCSPNATCPCRLPRSGISPPRCVGRRRGGEHAFGPRARWPRLLLRAEGVASSYLEGLAAPLAEVVLAESSHASPSTSAAWIAANLAVVDDPICQAAVAHARCGCLAGAGASPPSPGPGRLTRRRCAEPLDAVVSRRPAAARRGRHPHRARPCDPVRCRKAGPAPCRPGAARPRQFRTDKRRRSQLSPG